VVVVAGKGRNKNIEKYSALYVINVLKKTEAGDTTKVNIEET